MHDFNKFRIQVAQERFGHGQEDAGVHIAGARTHENTRRGMEFFDHVTSSKKVKWEN
jgi:hypothetical protein